MRVACSPRVEGRRSSTSASTVAGATAVGNPARIILANADVKRDPSLVVPSPEEYLEHLVESGLLHEIPGTNRYRTRLAETLRLLRTLRQLLPPGDESKPAWWRHSSTLVSDYRLRVSPRRYPARRIAVDDVIATLSVDGK